MLASILCSVSWKHSPHFRQTLRTRAIHPSSVGSHPKLMLSPGLGLHSLNLAHTPSLDSHGKVEDVLKEAIICSTGGGAAATARTGLSTSTSTAPTQIKRDAEALPLGGLPSTSSSTVCSPSKCRRTKSPSLQCLHGLAPPLLVRVWHLSTDQERVIQAHQVHWDWVLGLAVAVGPKVGPQLDPKPAQVHEIGLLTNSVCWKCQSPLWR